MLFVGLGLATMLGCQRCQQDSSSCSSKPAETPVKAEPAVDTPAMVKALERIDKIGGGVDRDDLNRVVGIDLLECKVTDADAEMISKTFPDLVQLVLWGAEIHNAGAKHLVSLTHLSRLTLEKTSIQDDLFKDLKALENLTVLNLRRNSFLTDKALESIKDYPRLLELRILFNLFTNEGMASVGQMSKLKVLDIRACPKIGDPGLAHLKDLVNLRSLKLRNASVTDAGLANLKGLIHLKDLAIQDAGRVTNNGLVILESFPDLEVLDLMRCSSLNDDALVHVKGLAKLRQLSLRGISIDGTGFKHFQGLAQLQRLDLNETKVSDIGLEHLKNLTSLKQLGLWHTRVTNNGLANLRGLINLEDLNLMETDISDDGLVHLQPLVRLQNLNLSSCQITDAGVKYLATMTSLRQLNIKQTQVSDAAIEKLQKALPDCAINDEDAAAPTE